MRIQPVLQRPRKSLTRALGALIAALCLTLAGAASGAADGIAKLHAFLAGAKTFSADFTQRIFDERMQAIGRSSGKLFFSRPGRFRWEYREPSPQEIVGDGKRVWFYDSDLDQVTVKPFDKALGSTPALLLTSQRPVESDFKLRDLGGDDASTWVELKPRTDDASFTTIRIGFAGAVLRQMELVDTFGQLTQLKFSGVRENPELDPGLFRFTPPAGVDVIQDR